MLSNPKVKIEKMWDAGENAGETVGLVTRYVGKNIAAASAIVFVGALMFIWAMGSSAVKSAFKMKNLDILDAKV